MLNWSIKAAGGSIPTTMNFALKHWGRLKRSWGRRYREWRLPSGYERLGTKYGGWWLDSSLIGDQPLLVDCGLGEDISFPDAFLDRFGGRVIGVAANPRSLDYCRRHCPEGMEIRPQAMWKTAGETLTFHLPRPQDQLPKGADGVSGSLMDSHEYVEGGQQVNVTTTSLLELLSDTGRAQCDVLKLDIEGAEYEVLEELCQSSFIRKTRQLLVEYHHAVTHHSLDETAASVVLIRDAGFDLVHIESRNHIFRRTGSAAP